jgi:chaperonin cofactor prefoldin
MNQAEPQKAIRGMFFKWMAKVWMSMLECAATPTARRRDMQDTVVADLHTCMEQLQSRMDDMENKITTCGEQAILHMHRADNSGSSAPARQRDRQRAKANMEERRRLQKQLDKAVCMNNAIQKQIDNIMSSHMDMLVVDAMRGFNHAATSMVLPQRLTEVETLGDQLADRQSEVSAMQEAIMGIGHSMDGCVEEEDLWQELDALMAPADGAAAAEAATAAAAAEAATAAAAAEAAAAAAAAEAAAAAAAPVEAAV